MKTRNVKKKENSSDSSWSIGRGGNKENEGRGSAGEAGARALENCSKEMRCPRCSWNFHAKWQANKYEKKKCFSFLH